MDSSIGEQTESPSSSICAPLEALQINGQSPQPGDTVEITVQGTVSSVEGEEAYIKPDTINGVPAPAPKHEETPAEPGNDEEIMSRVRKSDSESVY